MWTKILSNRASQIALKSLFGFFILILVGAFSLVILPALAWTEPTAAPPGNNVSAPVNVGSTFQTKSAGLGVQTLPGTIGVGLLVGQGDIVLGSTENIIYGNAKNTSTGSLLKLENCNDAGIYPSAATSGSPVLYGSNTYLAAIPTPPTPANDGSCTTPDPAYTYVQDGSGASYHITYCLGAQTGGVSAGWHTATPAGIQ